MKQLFKIYILAELNWDNKVEFEIAQFPRDYSESCTLVREEEIELEIPDDFDPRPRIVAKLEEKKTRVRAEAQKEITEIEEKIQSLLAIEGPK